MKLRWSPDLTCDAISTSQYFIDFWSEIKKTLFVNGSQMFMNCSLFAYELFLDDIICPMNTSVIWPACFCFFLGGGMCKLQTLHLYYLYPENLNEIKQSQIRTGPLAKSWIYSLWQKSNNHGSWNCQEYKEFFFACTFLLEHFMNTTVFVCLLDRSFINSVIIVICSLERSSQAVHEHPWTVREQFRFNKNRI